MEIELKRAHVHMYVLKVRERQWSKNIARDYNLVPAFLGKDKEKERAALCKVTKEKELRLKLRPVYQFMSCKEFDDLFEESAEYEAARHKHEKCKENKAAAAGGAKRGKEDGRDGEFVAIEHLPGFERLSTARK